MNETAAVSSFGPSVFSSDVNMRMFAVDQITCGAGEEADSSLMMESSSLVCSAADQSPAPNST